MDKKLLFAIIGLFVLLTALSLYLWWENTNYGTLIITSNQTEMAYRVNGGNEIRGTKLFQKVAVGTYKIEAFETQEGYYYPQTYSVQVTRKQKTELLITLKSKPKNPDVSGEEFDPYAN